MTTKLMLGDCLTRMRDIPNESVDVVACVNTNRNFIGIEIDPGYFNIAKDRIEKSAAERVQN